MTETNSYDFKTLIERRGTGSAKWNAYDEDVLPMWVADMDFQVAPAIQQALRERVEHGIFGYTMPPDTLKDAIVARMAAMYDWHIQPKIFCLRQA